PPAMIRMDCGRIYRPDAPVSRPRHADVSVVIHPAERGPSCMGSITAKFEVGPQRAAKEADAADQHLGLLCKMCAPCGSDLGQPIIPIECVVEVIMIAWH